METSNSQEFMNNVWPPGPVGHPSNGDTFLRWRVHFWGMGARLGSEIVPPMYSKEQNKPSSSKKSGRDDMKRWIITFVAVTIFGLVQGEAKADHNDLQRDMQMVASFYPKYLCRPVEKCDLDQWYKALLDGASVRLIEAEIIASDECWLHYDACPDDWMKNVLIKVKGSYNPNEAKYWLVRMYNVHHSRKAMVLELLNSVSNPVVEPPQSTVVIPPPQQGYSNQNPYGAPAVIIPPKNNYNTYNGNSYYGGPGKGKGYGLSHNHNHPVQSYYPPVNNVYGNNAPVVVPVVPQNTYYPPAQNSGLRIKLNFGF